MKKHNRPQCIVTRVMRLCTIKELTLATILLGAPADSAVVAATLDAMRGGVDVIVQAAVLDGQWVGRADDLSRTLSKAIQKLSLFDPNGFSLARL